MLGTLIGTAATHWAEESLPVFQAISRILGTQVMILSRLPPAMVSAQLASRWMNFQSLQVQFHPTVYDMLQNHKFKKPNMIWGLFNAEKWRHWPFWLV